MRDATLMTPWGLVGLRPALDHRLPEVRHVQALAGDWGVPMLGTVEQGHIEGGDVCLLRPGMVAIGYSGDRTNRIGARRWRGCSRRGAGARS
jgi:N-dimethylarginine dimethylaminohydrolase